MNEMPTCMIDCLSLTPATMMAMSNVFLLTWSAAVLSQSKKSGRAKPDEFTPWLTMMMLGSSWYSRSSALARSTAMMSPNTASRVAVVVFLVVGLGGFGCAPFMGFFLLGV